MTSRAADIAADLEKPMAGLVASAAEVLDLLNEIYCAVQSIFETVSAKVAA